MGLAMGLTNGWVTAFVLVVCRGDMQCGAGVGKVAAWGPGLAMRPSERVW